MCSVHRPLIHLYACTCTRRALPRRRLQRSCRETDDCPPEQHPEKRGVCIVCCTHHHPLVYSFSSCWTLTRHLQPYDSLEIGGYELSRDTSIHEHTSKRLLPPCSWRCVLTCALQAQSFRFSTASEQALLAPRASLLCQAGSPGELASLPLHT